MKYLVEKDYEEKTEEGYDIEKIMKYNIVRCVWFSR